MRVDKHVQIVIHIWIIESETVERTSNSKAPDAKMVKGDGHGNTNAGNAIPRFTLNIIFQTSMVLLCSVYPVYCGHVLCISHINSECIFHWIWATKCKVDVRKYLSMLLIAEINENPAWMLRNIIVYISIGPTIILACIHRHHHHHRPRYCKQRMNTFKKHTLPQDNLWTWSSLFV